MTQGQQHKEMDERKDRIRVFATSEGSAEAGMSQQSSCVFVTIGPGETRVTILDEEGGCERSWAAIFGWSSLCSIPILAEGKAFPLDDERLLGQAMTGELRAYGRTIDTREFIRTAAQRIEAALDDILSSTVGSGARYDAIVLAAPLWMHGILEESVDIRPHILREIREI